MDDKQICRNKGRRPPPRRGAARSTACFPEAVAIINGIRFWRREDIRRYQAALAGTEFISAPNDDAWVQSQWVRQQLGGVSAMWLHRRLRESRDAAIMSNTAV